MCCIFCLSSVYISGTYFPQNNCLSDFFLYTDLLKLLHRQTFTCFVFMLCMLSCMLCICNNTNSSLLLYAVAVRKVPSSSVLDHSVDTSAISGDQIGYSRSVCFTTSRRSRSVLHTAHVWRCATPLLHVTRQLKVKVIWSKVEKRMG